MLANRTRFFLKLKNSYDRPSVGERKGEWRLVEFDSMEEMKREAKKFKDWNDLVSEDAKIEYKMLVIEEDDLKNGND